MLEQGKRVRSPVPGSMVSSGSLTLLPRLVLGCSPWVWDKDFCRSTVAERDQRTHYLLESSRCQPSYSPQAHRILDHPCMEMWEKSPSALLTSSLQTPSKGRVTEIQMYEGCWLCSSSKQLSNSHVTAALCPVTHPHRGHVYFESFW